MRTILYILLFAFTTYGHIHSVELHPSKRKEIAEKNREKFEMLRQLNLPLGHYAVMSSGPLGIRNLREIGDIDIIVSRELWDALASKYGVHDKDGMTKIVFLEGLIEAFTEGSFYTKPLEKEAPTVKERLAKADIIEGLPFESLEHVLYFKRLAGREKDLKDILLIETWMKENTQKGT